MPEVDATDTAVSNQNHRPSRTSWPVMWVVIAIVWGWLFALSCTMSLDGQARQNARNLVQSLIAFLYLARLILAVVRKEQSNSWIFYVVTAILSAPLWIVAESLALGT